MIDIKTLETELLIIGSGPGGYVAAIYAAKKGLKVTLIEKSELGGTCLNVGCIPTKSLVKSAEIYKNVKESQTFGVKIDGEFQVDMKEMINRKDQVTKRLVSGIELLMKKNKIQVIKGMATFLSKEEVIVKGKQDYKIHYKDVIIATGSRLSKVNIPGIDLPFVMNSTDALSCTNLPKTITIIGGGVIGVEFAFIYRNLGVEVEVIEFLDRLLTMVDKDISKEIGRLAKKAGIKVHTSARVTQIDEDTDNQAVITYEDKKGEHKILSDKVFVAIGREPNLDGLDITKAGVNLNERSRGIAVDKKMNTSVPHIYAIGDCTDIMQLAHVASHQGIVAVDNVLGNEKTMDYSAVPNVIFTIPEIATIGLSEEDCREQKIDYSISKATYRANGKALTMNQPEGFVKLIKDNSTNSIIGGAIIGADASSLISTLTLAIKHGVKDTEMREMIFPHPTTSEVIHEALYGFSVGALHQP